MLGFDELKNLRAVGRRQTGGPVLMVFFVTLVGACTSSPTSDRPGHPGDPSGGGDPGGGDSAIPDPLDLCPDATLLHFSLTPRQVLPDPADLELPDLPTFMSVESAGDGQSNSMRLDVCRNDDGSHQLAAVLRVFYSFSIPEIYIHDPALSQPSASVIDTSNGMVYEIRLPTADFLVIGLEAAVAGDVSSLEIRLVYDSGLLAMGQDDFVAVARGQVTATSISYTASTIVVGGLAPGDVFADLQCHFGETPLDTGFTLATADFLVSACTFLGGGMTTGYRIFYLAVQDSSAELTTEEQAQFVLDGEAAVNEMLNYQWNHHNACDSFHLALPHADYAASAAPAAGCGPTVPNAPERDFTDPPTSPVAYRIRYHGGDWTEGTMDSCTHYLFCP